MNGVWVNLVWKEAREHAWKLAALVTIVIGIHAWTLYRASQEAVFGDYADALGVVNVFLLPLAAAFLGMGAAAGERASGTLPFVTSLPSTAGRIAAAKLALAILTLWIVAAVAVGLTCGLMYVGQIYSWDGISRAMKYLSGLDIYSTGHWTSNWLVVAGLCASSILIWVAACGVNHVDQIRAGAIGLLVCVGSWLVFLNYFFWFDYDDTYRNTVVYQVGAAILPGGIATLPRQGDRWLPVIVLFAVVHVGLAASFVSRFGRLPERQSPRINNGLSAASATVALRSPRRSPFLALAWKQLRECVPVVLVGLICAAATAGVFIAAEMASRGRFRGFTPDDMMGIVTLLTLFGCLAGIVTGIGVAVRDLERQSLHFWRSRPINVDGWFLSCVGTGICSLFVGFGFPSLLGLGALTWWVGYFETGTEYVPYFISIALVISFVAGLLASSLVREPIYAAILAVGGAMTVLASLVALQPKPAPAVIATLLIAIALTLAAWLAVRYDWALKR